MSDLLVLALVAAAFIYILRRFASSASSSSSTAGGTGAGASRGASGARAWVDRHIDQVTVMFPQAPLDRVAYDLSRTRSVAATVEKLLAGAPLPSVPAGSEFAGYSRTSTSSSSAAAANGGSRGARAGAGAGAAQSSSGAALPSKDDLIKRYNLASRLSTLPEDPTSGDALQQQQQQQQRGSFSSSDGPQSAVAGQPAAGAGEQAAAAGQQTNYSWSKLRSEREASLRQRKEDAVLQARAKLLARERESAAAGASSAGIGKSD